MEVHRQQCQSCMTMEVRNILAREPNAPTVVYVCCIHCSRLVARYELSDYYHHGKGVESFLRSKATSVEESGRKMVREYDEVRKRAIEGYKKVLEELERQGKEI